MENIIQVKEAARRLGVTHQTVKNWASNGVISVLRIGRSYYVREAEIDAIFSDAHDIEETCRRLKKLKETYEEEERKMFKDREEDTWQRRYLNISVRSSIRTQFFQMTVDMLRNLGCLNDREALILDEILDGKPLSELCKRFELKSERIRQIARGAIRKSAVISKWKEKIESISTLETDNKVLLGEVADLKRKLLEQDDYEKAEFIRTLEESDEMCKLLKTPLYTMGLSVRTLNSLKSYTEWTPNGSVHMPIKTVGDLVRINKGDCLKLRQFGRKCLSEVEELIESLGLHWKMDVDAIFKERIDLLIEKEKRDIREDANLL